MKHAIFYQFTENNYVLQEDVLNDLGITLLYILVQRFAAARDILIEKIRNPHSRRTGFNDIHLSFEGNRASIFCDFDMDEVLEIDRDHLLELVIQWDDLCKREVQEITIRRDGERFEIEEANLELIRKSPRLNYE